MSIICTGFMLARVETCPVANTIFRIILLFLSPNSTQVISGVIAIPTGPLKEAAVPIPSE
jgi:hypothetical protein